MAAPAPPFVLGNQPSLIEPGPGATVFRGRKPGVYRMHSMMGLGWVIGVLLVVLLVMLILRLTRK